MENVLKRFLLWLGWLCDFSPVKLAVVRRYRDANGHNVGELYLFEPAMPGRRAAFNMIGASLDNLPFDYAGGRMWRLDTKHDFLAPMPPDTIRVGAVEPQDNDAVCRRVNRLPRWNMTVILQNRFVEYVLEGKR